VAGRDHTALREQIQHWLADRVDGPVVSELEVPPTPGMSSETVLFEAAWFEGGVRRMHRCVLRMPPDPGAEPLFPAYDMVRQYKAIELVGRRTAVPVPPLLWLETDPSYLAAPFFVMRRVDGLVPPDHVPGRTSAGHAAPYTFGDNWLFDADPSDQRRLQDRSVAVLANLHTISADEPAADSQHDGTPGPTALRRHVTAQRSYYRWVVRDGVRSPLIERAFDWLIANWPVESPAVVSWGDARIGNIIYRDFEPAAVLDWELAGLGPRELDLGWMVYLHRFLQDMAEHGGMRGMPEFMLLDDVVETYEQLTGYRPQEMHFYVAYAALRQAIVMSRITRRQVRLGHGEMPDDADHTFLHHRSLESMLDGSYWRKLW
jgi:aminoglycoside phosphotransferase (APT) family kinase protein